MRNELRIVCSLVLMVLMGSSAVVSLAQQQQRQGTPVDVVVQGTGPIVAFGPAQDRTMFERQISQGQGPAIPNDFVFLATEMSFSGALVKGAPYSAQAVTESVQTLADGNRIVNRSTASVYRDSEGRTRREQTLRSVGAFTTSGVDQNMTIFINDPVAGTSYTLDQKTMTARKMMPMRFKVSSPGAATGAGGGAGAGGGTAAGVGTGAGAGGNAEVKTYREGVSQVILERSPAAAGGDYKVMVEQSAQNEKRNVEAGVAMGIMSTRNRSARTESLGKQNINGVEAEGTRTTVTIAAGEIGNERAIETVSERWYSPDLKVIVKTLHTDPRFGENSYQLTNINRSEPAHDLFEVPAGYTIKDFSVGQAVAPSGGGLNGGTLNGKAITLPLPRYPEIARQAKASGTVTVQITIDEDGNVISAQSVSGHPLLREAALTAARDAKFSPTKLNGQSVKVNGQLVYNFVAQ